MDTVEMGCFSYCDGMILQQYPPVSGSSIMDPSRYFDGVWRQASGARSERSSAECYMS